MGFGVSFLIAGITATIAGTTAAIQGGVSGHQQQRQARAIRANARALQRELEQGEIRRDEAIERLNTMLNQTQGRLREILGEQMSSAIEEHTREYRQAVRVGTQQLRDAMTQRRLGASGAFTAASERMQSEMADQYTRATEQTRQQGLQQMQQMVSQLDSQRMQQSEAIRQQHQDFDFGITREIMKLDSMANRLFPEGAGAGFAAGRAIGAGAEAAFTDSTAFGLISKELTGYDPQEDRN